MCVQVSGGLVRQYNLRLVNDRPGDGHALLLSSGEFSGPVLQAALQSQHVGDNLEAVRIEFVPVNVLRDGNISARIERRQQVKSLKYEADFAPPQQRSCRSESLMVTKSFPSTSTRPRVACASPPIT